MEHNYSLFHYFGKHWKNVSKEKVSNQMAQIACGLNCWTGNKRQTWKSNDKYKPSNGEYKAQYIKTAPNVAFHRENYLHFSGFSLLVFYLINFILKYIKHIIVVQKIK